jgi:NAD(P)-dependent dehydrogenase (short-subunit alcohol dehydrogenase family)
VDSFGKLDILVNNAARIMSKLVVDMTRDDWESIMSVNVTGAFLHSREAMKVMIPQQEWRNSQHCVLCCLLRLPADRRLHIIEGRACTVDANACA